MPAEYFIKAAYSRDRAWVERDQNDTDWQTTVADIFEGQIDHPLEVWCAEDGRWSEVSEDIARAVADMAIQSGERLSRNVHQFVETHTTVAFARGLDPESHPLMRMHDTAMRLLAAE